MDDLNLDEHSKQFPAEITEEGHVLISVNREVRSRLAPRAERIRNLVNTARGCVIEAGLELVAASEEVPPGQWGAWLREEFGWTTRTAEKYRHVAIAFRGESGSPPYAVNIDSSALYLLAAPTVPDEVRKQAVEQGEAGERVTREEAERLIAERVAKTVAEQQAIARQNAAAMQEEIDTLQARRQEIENALSAAQEEVQQAEERGAQAAAAERDEELRQTREKADILAKSLEEIEDSIKAQESARPEPPTLDDAIDLFKTMLGRKKLNPKQISGLAQVLGKTIEYEGRLYGPVDETEAKAQERAARLCGAFERALGFFAKPEASPEEMFDASPAFMRQYAEISIAPSVKWLRAYLRLLNGD